MAVLRETFFAESSAGIVAEAFFYSALLWTHGSFLRKLFELILKINHKNIFQR
jgi:hypothetical protein